MEPKDLTAWRDVMGRSGKPISKARAASLLGIHSNTFNRYEAGDAPIPLFVALACAAVAYGLPPWKHIE